MKTSENLNQSVELGKRLKELRIECGWSQTDVIAKLQGIGVKASSSQISGWESGNGRPRPDKLLSLAKLFNVYVKWLNSGEGPRDLSTPDILREPVPCSYSADNAELDRPLLAEIFREVLAQGSGQPVDRLAEAAAEAYFIVQKKGKSVQVADAVRMWIS